MCSLGLDSVCSPVWNVLWPNSISEQNQVLSPKLVDGTALDTVWITKRCRTLAFGLFLVDLLLRIPITIVPRVKYVFA